MSTTFFTNIVSLENLYAAVEKLQQEQPLLKDRHWLRSDLDQKLQQIHTDLIRNNYVFDPIEYYYTWQDKYILSAQLTCRDWIVHHAICLQLHSFFQKKQHIYSAYQPRDTSKLIAQAQQWKRQYDWVLGVDIKSFFGSIAHPFLLKKLDDDLREEAVLRLLQQFLEALNKAALTFSKQEPLYHYEANLSLPIGLELCYLFANAYLQTIDQQLHQQHFIRYIDDFLFFSNDKKALWNLKTQLDEQLQNMGLRFNEEKTFLKSTQEGFVYLRHEF